MVANAPPTTRDTRGATAGLAKEFVARILGDTEDVWDTLFTAMGSGSYPRPVVVLYAGQVASACGHLSKDAHPSYCAADSRVYLDKAYLTGLPQRTGRGGEYAVAYLIAHEIGHHVQQVLDKQRGTSPAAMPGVQASTPQERLELELQADCYAGVWTHFVQKRGLLDPGDLEDGVPAALAAGDPLIQGDVAKRRHWFMRGLGSGDPRSCQLGK